MCINGPDDGVTTQFCHRDWRLSFPANQFPWDSYSSTKAGHSTTCCKPTPCVILSTISSATQLPGPRSRIVFESQGLPSATACEFSNQADTQNKFPHLPTCDVELERWWIYVWRTHRLGRTLKDGYIEDFAADGDNCRVLPKEEGGRELRGWGAVLLAFTCKSVDSSSIGKQFEVSVLFLHFSVM